jgi:hypothetical protein
MQPIARQSLDVTQRLTDETRFLKTRTATQAVVTGMITVPANYFTFNSMRYGYQRMIDGVSTVVWKAVEPLTESEYSDRAGNWTKKPSAKNPVCVIRNDGIFVYPIIIVQVDFTYIRFPVDPVFSYVQAQGYITADESGSTQYEWPEHLHMDLTSRILSFIGINIREQQLQQYAEQHKAQGV